MDNFILLLLLQSCVSFTNAEILKIEITHWGDVKGQIESFLGDSPFSTVPESCPKDDLTCLGGVVSLVHHIHEPPAATVSKSLRLCSGNLLGGESGWISSIGWEEYAKFVRDHFKPDVLTLGINEFAGGLSKTNQYMNTINKDWTSKKDIFDEINIVIANTCDKSYRNDTSEYQFCRRISKIKTIAVASSRIGVIGFVTPTVQQLSSPGKLKFGNVSTEIQNTITDNPDVNTFIAIGDGNLKMAEEIIDQNPQVKLVMYSEGLSSLRKIADNRPISYKNSFIITTGQYGSSIQKLILDWDTNTRTFAISSNASKVIATKRPETWNKNGLGANSVYSTQFLPAVDNDKKHILGHSRVTLHGGEKCWRGECNLGNLVTDAMVHCALVKSPDSNPLPYPLLSIWYGGAFLKDTVKSGVQISKFDIHKWLPRPNRAHLVKVTGVNLHRLFEVSAGGIDPEKGDHNDWGQFLQVSKAIQVVYDGTVSDAPKLTQVRITHLDKSGMPQVAGIEDSREYYLVIPTYLYEGRGVYEFANFWEDMIHPNISSNFASDLDCVANYVATLRELSIGYEDRIIINKGAGDTSDCNWKRSSSAYTIFLVSISSVHLLSFIIPH